MKGQHSIIRFDKKPLEDDPFSPQCKSFPYLFMFSSSSFPEDFSKKFLLLLPIWEWQNSKATEQYLVLVLLLAFVEQLQNTGKNRIFLYFACYFQGFPYNRKKHRSFRILNNGFKKSSGWKIAYSTMKCPTIKAPKDFSVCNLI